MMKVQDGNVYNVSIPTYYVESEAEISEIPENAPAGTIVEINAASGFKVKMKASDGTWREL